MPLVKAILKWTFYGSHLAHFTVLLLSASFPSSVPLNGSYCFSLWKPFIKETSGIAVESWKRERGEAKVVLRWHWFLPFLLAWTGIFIQMNSFDINSLKSASRTTAIMHAQLTCAVHIHWVWCLKIITMPIFLTFWVKIGKPSTHFQIIWVRTPWAPDLCIPLNHFFHNLYGSQEKENNSGHLAAN